MNRCRWSILGLLLFLLAGRDLGAQTNVSGIIGVNTTWTTAGSPYIVTGTVYVQAATPITLTIQPGVTVKFNANTALIAGSGYPTGIQAVGTSTQPIVFTANTVTPSAGFWKGVQLFSGTLSSTQIAYSTISYAGVTGTSGGLHVSSCVPTISNVTTQSNLYAGISVIGAGALPSISTTTMLNNTGDGLVMKTPASASLNGATFTGNSGWAINQDAAVTFGTVTGLTASGNGTDAVQVSGIVGVNTTWRSVGLPYVATTDILVQSFTSQVLTIEPGVTVKFNAGKALIVGSGYTAGLQAVGTLALPIVFTANTASPSAGFWKGLQLLSGSVAGTQIAYSTISYAGLTGTSGGLHISSCTPTISNVTSQNNLYAGISVVATGALPSIASTTMLNNTGDGLVVKAPASASLNGATFTGNSGWAINLDATVTLGTVTGVTASGNGTNAVQVSGVVGVNTTWRSFGLPYVAAGDINVQSFTSQVLTIEPGVTVKFNAGKALIVGNGYTAGLQAVGTSAQPIVFTANTASPSAGFWKGVWLTSGTMSSSRISYATVTYGGVTGLTGGVYLNNSSPTVDHVQLLNNAHSGLSASGSAGVVTNCNFSADPAGIVNATPSTILTAPFNYWASSTGPSGSGPGTGLSVTAGVTFEPWLNAASSTPNFFSSSSVINRTFNPSISVNPTIAATTTLSGSWTISILSSGGTTLRTYSGSGTTSSAIWDGKNGSGVDQPTGTYSYQLASVAGGGTATPAIGTLLLDRTKQLVLTNVAISQSYFSPNGDGIQDLAIVSGNATFDSTAIAFTVKNSGGATVRTGSATGTAFSFPWDGKNGSGTLQPDGSYTVEILATAGTASVPATLGTVLDNTMPVVSLVPSPEGLTYSNVYSNGVTDVVFSGSATDTNIVSWTLGYGWSWNPQSFTTIGTGVSSVTSVPLGTLATLPITNGQYTFRLQASDRAGNVSNFLGHATVSNFKLSQNAWQISPPSAQTVTYTSLVPFTLTETLTLRNEAGQIVRTLVSGVSRPASSYNDVWDGKTSGAAYLPDGGYYVAAAVNDATHSATFDLTNQYRTDCSDFGETLSGSFDPFRNQPLIINYNPGCTGRVSVGFSPGTGDIAAGCPPPDFCFFKDRYQEIGPKTLQWAGVDSAGKPRLDARRISVVTQSNLFSQNAIVVFGTRPSVTNVAAVPTVYSPGFGTQGVSFDLATFQSQTATITVSFLNHESLSTLRTISVPGQSAGHLTVPWDGKADNGMWVAPGAYTVAVTATDGIGNQTVGYTLTTVRY